MLEIILLGSDLSYAVVFLLAMFSVRQIFGCAWLEDTLFSGVPLLSIACSYRLHRWFAICEKIFDLGSYALELIVRSECKCRCTLSSQVR